MFELLPCALIIAAIALATDLENRRIPNGLTLPAIVFGLAAQLAVHGWGGLGLALLGLVIGGGLLWLPFLAGFMGAGDVKLMAAIGVFVGPLAAVLIVLIASLVAGLLACAVIARRGLFGRAMQGAMRLCGGNRRLVGSVGSLPYAVPIAVGTVLVAPFLHLLIS